MAAIGARGFETTVNRHFGGDRASYVKYLHDRAHETLVEGFVDRVMQERLDKGEQTVCVELPIITDPDDEPPF